ncbi:LysR family transcriptional regulator [Paracoccus sp. (in: a-proteobacteria)]|uniref:LysR family transcriptional regulator n=1 Tax=Paracoccus sp. TaxID=267 RepID=UPI00396CBA66
MNWLKDLRVLSETLNFSRAAERRNITQPAFGRRIRSLEEWCGTALIDRCSHRIALTPAGRIMLEAAVDVTGRLERVRHDLEQVQAATATLTFTATHALSFNFFPAWIHGLGALASTQPMRLLSDNMNHCEKIMLAGGAQFLLCHYHPGSSIALPAGVFDHIVLARDRLIPVVGRDANGQPLHSLPGTDKDRVPYLAFEHTSGMGRILSAALLTQVDNLHLTPVLSSHLAMVLKALAVEGKGVAWIPQSLARDELGPIGRLTSGGPRECDIEVNIALFRPRARMSDIAERFWDLARGALIAPI